MIIFQSNIEKERKKFSQSECNKRKLVIVNDCKMVAKEFLKVMRQSKKF